MSTIVARSGGDPTNARRAIQELEAELAQSHAGQSLRLLEAKLWYDGRIALAEWIREKQLVRSTELLLAWSIDRRELKRLCAREELFTLKIIHRRWYPALFKKLPIAEVKAVCLALKGLDPTSKFIYWKRPHGGLRGRTVSEVLRNGERLAVLRHANGFAAEYLGLSMPVGTPAPEGNT